MPQISAKVVDEAADLGRTHLPANFLLSVVIPVFNEAPTVLDVICRVRESGLPCEIIVVNDGSTDDTRAVLETLTPADDLQIIHKLRNEGKGAALRLGFSKTRGSVVIVQDADLEYDPADYRSLVKPILTGNADVVFGSRFQCPGPVSHNWHYAVNRILTWLSNVFTKLNLSDMETCYKVFRGDVIRGLAPALREQRFGVEPELTAKLAHIPGLRLLEQPIHYAGRNYSQGKKIGWRDGFRAVWCIVRYGLWQ